MCSHTRLVQYDSGIAPYDDVGWPGSKHQTWVTADWPHVEWEYWPCVSPVTELHLLEYIQMKLEYLWHLETRKQQTSFFSVPLKTFTQPWDPNGYHDKSIADDMISDVYLAFSDQTRSPESQAYLRTLKGQCFKRHDTIVAHRGIQQLVSHSTIHSRCLQKRLWWTKTGGTASLPKAGY